MWYASLMTNTIKRVALSVLAAAALAACSTQAPETTTEAPETAQEPAVEETVVEDGLSVTESVYVDVVRSYYPEELSPYSDDDLINLGNAVCTDLSENGVNFYDVLVTFAENGEPWSTVGGVLTGAAVPAFCPEYNDEMEEFISEVENL